MTTTRRLGYVENRARRSPFKVSRRSALLTALALAALASFALAASAPDDDGDSIPSSDERSSMAGEAVRNANDQKLKVKEKGNRSK